VDSPVLAVFTSGQTNKRPYRLKSGKILKPLPAPVPNNLPNEEPDRSLISEEDWPIFLKASHLEETRKKLNVTICDITKETKKWVHGSGKDKKQKGG
jgi:hypothetical protein